MYIHELNDWPEFTWNQSKISNQLAEVRHLQGRLLGRMESLGFALREEASLQTLTQDVLKTSEIEGEKLNGDSVRSSIARRIGLDIGALHPVDRNVEGIVEIMLDATRNHAAPLTAERLINWHAALFPTGRSGLQKIVTGGWRGEASGPMQVVSGGYGQEKIHFEAPSHEGLQNEMTRFLNWFDSPSTTDPVLRAAVAHFWLVTIHPFDDGNGRIARAIADLMLARSEKTSSRFYSMSSQIQLERNDYYDVLEHCQKGTLDITVWIEWFLGCLKRSIESSGETLATVLAKAHFWKTHEQQPLNERQRLILNRLLDGFEGKLTSGKWAKLTKCSPDTALRDIHDLVREKNSQQR